MAASVQKPNVQLEWDCLPTSRQSKSRLAAGAVKPGTSGSVEIFTADLLIPAPGLRVAFTYKPSMPASQLQLELWCWMEPSNSDSDTAGTTTGPGSVADDGSQVRGTESGARQGGSGAKQSESRARSSESRAAPSEEHTQTASSESGARANQPGGRISESGVRMLAMLQATGAVIVTDKPGSGCTDAQRAATAVADL